MDVFPAIRFVEGDGGQGIDHVEGLGRGRSRKFRFLCDHCVTIAVIPSTVKSCPVRGVEEIVAVRTFRSRLPVRRVRHMDRRGQEVQNNFLTDHITFQ